MPKKKQKGSASSPQTNSTGGVVGQIIERKVLEVHLRSWNDFKSFLVRLYGDTGFKRDRFLFRGQGSDYWELESIFDRQFPVSQYDKGLRVWKILN